MTDVKVGNLLPALLFAPGLVGDSGIKAKLAQSMDARGWELRVGPLPGEDVARVIDAFIW